MRPRAVHGYRGLECESLCQEEVQVARQDKAVGDVLVVVGAGHVLTRGGEVGSVEVVVEQGCTVGEGNAVTVIGYHSVALENAVVEDGAMIYPDTILH